MNKKIVITGVCLILSAIILGAFGAHGLKEHVSTEKISSFEVGVRYQMYHGLAFLVLGLNVGKLKFSLNAVYSLLLIGTLLFSVSIYFLAIQEIIGVSMKFLGPVTPLGGVLLILGWVIFLYKLIRTKE